MLNPYITRLNERLASGRLNEVTYGNILKNYYDSNALFLDQDSIGFLETKLSELGIPIDNSDATDGIIKQAVSGLIEGFTTFGIADKPDTPMEKIVNNVTHLLGLAPGIMMGGARMLTSATATVGKALVSRGAAESSKSLVNLGNKLVAKSNRYASSSDRLQRSIGRLADTTLLKPFRSNQPVMLDPVANRAIYDLKSIPGKLAEIVQMQGIAALGKNKGVALNAITSGLLLGQFSKEGVSRILHEAGHVGLLMAFSQHPLAARNEGGMSWEGVKDMAMAGMHGGIAGGIFGTIGQYGNISKLMTSTNPALVKVGENIIRKTASTLATKNTVEATEFINTMVRGTAGAGYGGIVSSMNDYPVEEQIYETLMGVFFSVNARPSWQSRATKDINLHANRFDRTKSVKEQVEILKREEFFTSESKDYQLYWVNHFEAIRQQQLTSKEIISDEMGLQILKMVKKLEKSGKITQEEIKLALKGKSKEEGKLGLLQSLVALKEKITHDDYTPNIDILPYKPSQNIDLTILTGENSFKHNLTPGNEVDFPVHSLTELSKRVADTVGYDITQETFFRDIIGTFNRVKKKSFFKDSRGVKHIDIDKFVASVKRKYPLTKFTPNDIKEARRVGLRFDNYRPVINDFVIDFTDPIKKGDEKKLGNARIIPPVDPKGNTLGKLTSGRRDDFKGFTNMGAKSISYMVVTQGGKPVYVSPFARKTTYIKGKPVVEPYVSEKDWYAFENDLNANREFIYGAIADTGRVEIRSFPWSPEGKKGHWTNANIADVYNTIVREAIKTDVGKDWYKNSVKGTANLKTKVNTVATMIYRMRDMGIIENNKQLDPSRITTFKKYIAKYLQAERTGDYQSPAKFQKYLNQIDKAEIPFLDGTRLGLPDNDMNGILLEDLNSGIRASETDGTIILNATIFDKLVRYMGNDASSGMSKGTLYSKPLKTSEGARNDAGNRSLIIGKFAYARADKADMKYMTKENLQFMMYTSAAKHKYGLETNLLNAEMYDASKKTIDQEGIYPDAPNKFKVQTKDFNWNIDVREKINVTGKLNIMQQMFLNANSVQFDPSTDIGRKFHDSWVELMDSGIKGDIKVTKEAIKRLGQKKHKGKNLKGGRDLEGLDIDQIDIATIDKIMTTRTKSEAFRSILKHLYFENKHGQFLDSEQSEFKRVTERHVGQHLADANWSWAALQSRGTSEFVQKTLRNYIMSRIIRPKVSNSYAVILGPYDWKYSLRKQKYSSAEKGLADDEFMLWSGAKQMKVKDPDTGKNIRLDTWWMTMKDVLSLNMSNTRVAAMSAEQLNAWRDSQYAIINRSPVMTAGNMRALKFVGFAGGKGGKGFSLITNSRNDNMMGGADKDIDSAHLSWGMPEGIKKGYRQDHVQYEFAKDWKNPVEDYELKDDKFIRGVVDMELAGSDPYGILSFSNKLKAADSATYGKDSIGIIFNGFTQIKQITDLHLQSRKDLSQNQKLEIWQEIARMNAAIGNRYIDAAETTKLEDAHAVMKKVRKHFTNSYDIPLDNATVRKFNDFHNATIKARLKKKGPTYEQISEEMLDLHGDLDTMASKIASYTKNLNLTIDPLVGLEKDNVFQIVAMLNEALAKDPYARAFGIENDSYFKNLFFNPKTLIKSEEEAIKDHPHFLYNKMATIRVVKAVEETYKFFDEPHKVLGDNVTKEKTIAEALEDHYGMKRNVVDSFVHQLIHTAQQQKFMFSGQANAKLKKFGANSKNDPNQMTYPETVLMSKKYLKQALTDFYAKKTIKQSKGTIPKSHKDLINREVEKLFEYWHEASPFMELNYNTMPEIQRAAFEKRKKEWIRVKDRLENLVKWKNGIKAKGPQRENKWLDDDASEYYKLREQLGRYEYEARNFQPKGQNNMMRNAAISREVKRDIYAFEEKILSTLQGGTEKSRSKRLFSITTLEKPKPFSDKDGPGTSVDVDIKFSGKFATDLLDWEALGSAANFKKEIASQIKSKEKIISKYKMTPEALTHELDRMGDIVTRMVKHGQTSHVMDLTGIYLKAFEKLDVVSKQGIEEVDYNHLRIFSNILENRYLDGWKEWGARKTIHRKLIKEISVLEKEHGSKLMPPEFDTDLLFPSEVSKILEKVEKVYTLGTAQVVKDGIFTEVGIRYPTGTSSSIATSIGRSHTAGITLFAALEEEFNARLDYIRAENYKDYKKIQPVVESLAAFERQMGLKGNEAVREEGPRPKEADRSIANLRKNILKYRKLLNDIDSDFKIRIVERGTDKKFDYTPRDMVEHIKDIQTKIMTDAYNVLFTSNHVVLKTMLSGKQLVQGNFRGGVFDFNKFYNVSAKDRISTESPQYMHQAMSEMFMDKHGVIQPDRLMFIESVNLNDRRLAQGKEVVRKHFHAEDLTWAEFQLDILDMATETFGTILKDGSVGLDYAKLKRTQSDTKMNVTKYEELQTFIRETNLSKVADTEIGFIGQEDVDGVRFSTKYHPLAHPNTKEHIKFIQNEHIPRETLRFFGKLQNIKTREYYTEFNEIDIEAFKRGEVVGRYDSKLGLTESQLMQESSEISRSVEQGYLTIEQAAKRLYDNMVNKLVNNPEQYNNVFYDQVAFDRVSRLSTRRGALSSPGVGKIAPTRKRAPVPVEGYDTSLEAYRRYLKTASLGVTSQRAALISRLHIRNFKYNTLPGNKRIDPDVGRRWLHKIIDITKGYMNMPSTRSLELNGVTSKDMTMLMEYADSGYSLHFMKENPKYDVVDAKLINDIRMYTRPSQNEINNMEKKLYKKYRFNETADILKTKLDKINTSKATVEVKKQLRFNLNNKFKTEKTNKKARMLKELYGEYRLRNGTLIKRNKIAHIDYAENIIQLQSGKTVQYDPSQSSVGMIRAKTIEYRNDFIYKTGTKEANTDNIDITNIRKSFRNFYSDEAVGNVMLRAESRINKALGHLTDGRIQIFKSLPKDPTARHKAMVDKLSWFADMEGKFEMMALLSHPKSAIANLYGGTTNLISDVGFNFYLKSFQEEYLVNEIFKGKTYKKYDNEKQKFTDEPIEDMNDVHSYMESFGFLEANILKELVMMQPSNKTDWQGFVNVIGPKIVEGFKQLPVYTKNKEINKTNKEKRNELVNKHLTFGEASKEFGISKFMLDKGAYFMRTTERHLRLKTAISHYLKGRDLFTDSRGRVEVSEQFLLEFAQKGIEASQFIYHATNRPNFSNSNMGKVMTRFHPYSWNSIRRRANIISDRMITEGYGDFDANKKFERQLSADLMVSALSTVFAASIFEYALSPPMSWMVDFSHLMYGSQEEKERAFYNQYGHPLLSPLSIVTPPIGRFVLQPITSIINNDWDSFVKYTAATAFPFGRVVRDGLKVIETPEMAFEFGLGLPIHALGRLGNRPDKEEDDTDDVLTEDDL